MLHRREKRLRLLVNANKSDVKVSVDERAGVVIDKVDAGAGTPIRTV